MDKDTFLIFSVFVVFFLLLFGSIFYVAHLNHIEQMACIEKRLTCRL